MMVKYIYSLFFLLTFRFYYSQEKMTPKMIDSVYIQVTPMILFSYEDLYPLLTKEFKQEIL